jgi:hypothetical protein
MTYYTADKLLEIKQRVDILAIAAALDLNPRMDRRKSRLPLIDCPACFALAYVVTTTVHGYALWGCFSCRKRGDVFRMVQAALRIPPSRFPEVMMWLQEQSYY